MYYTFSDGSGNKYILENSILIYKPIVKKESSSGFYDGGLPFNKKLNKIELLQLIDALERALWNENDHTLKRTKGSGAIGKKSGSEMVLIYLKYNSNSIKNIEEVLLEIREKL